MFFELDKPDPRWAVSRRIRPDDLRVYFTRGSEPDRDPGVFDLSRR